MYFSFKKIATTPKLNASITYCAIVRGKIKGAGVPIYAIWHCPLGLPSANMRIVAHRRLNLISHALNEILALGIPRYTGGQLVATAFFLHCWKRNTVKVQEKKQDTKLSVH